MATLDALLSPMSKGSHTSPTSTSKGSGKEYTQEFSELVAKDIEGQVEHFLKTFIFALGDDWKTVSTVANEFRKYLVEKSEKFDLDPAQAADFLQRMGKTRTAKERKEELADIDLNFDNRISLTEYLLLHYKALILKEYFKRKEIQPNVDLSRDGIGLVGVGHLILEQLFTQPLGLDASLIAAIEDFMSKKKARESQMSALRDKSKQAGVKGLTAKTELHELENMDTTDMNRIEITLNAAKKKSSKASGDVELQRKKQAEEQAALQDQKKSRDALKMRASLFEKHA